ncbi:hypothetical protein B0T16DRAFT_225090 [Cercophora newfieldiana]|uniref:F-box domain-containing protein n=1 Tax=Cercophora newfieldiana TaxID=92897 RepID=A0AA39XXJ5_9PEZI|nr:hypothetical protein B0T16DRAFT_225090 [Cercophora newfieldiana]
MTTARDAIPEDYRSVEPYDVDSLGKEDKTRILEAVANPPRHDSFVNSRRYLSRYRLVNIFARPPAAGCYSPSAEKHLDQISKPEANLGQLDSVPLEIQLQIIQQLDIQATLELRKVNRRARQLVGSTAEYRLVTSHATPALQYIFAIKVADSISFVDLAQALRTLHCTFGCGTFGEFFFLPTQQRCCRECLERREELSMAALMKNTTANRLPIPADSLGPDIMITVGMQGKEHDFAGFLPMNEDGREWAIQDALELAPSVYRQLLRYMALPIALPTDEAPSFSSFSMWIGPKNLVPFETPPFDDTILHQRLQECLRCTASVSLPCLDGSGHLDNGILCKGCDKSRGECCTNIETLMIVPAPYDDAMAALMLLYDLERRVYSRGSDAFWEHFKWCRGAQSLWAAAKAQMDSPDGEGSETANKGSEAE